MKKLFLIALSFIITGAFSACKKYLNVVPDNVATIDYAFRLRSTAEKFLFTCYSYMPSHGSLTNNPAFFAGDEVWLPPSSGSSSWQIAKGNQRVVDPECNFWEGEQKGTNLYQGIRMCNIFLDNIGIVPDMEDFERDRWIAEVKFLKAYYYFWLVRMYGPVVLYKENLPVSASAAESRKFRSPVDSCFNYIVQLLDEAVSALPDRIDNEVSERGRITKVIDLSVKAMVLVTAASPLFNGNADYKGFNNSVGQALFNTTFDPGKWQKASDACKKAVDLCESLGYRLYYYQPEFSQNLSDTTIVKMSIRNAICEKWNSEIIWGNTNSIATSIQALSTPRGLDPTKLGNTSLQGYMAPPLKIVEMFYSNHGVPINEDKTWNYSGRFTLEKAGTANKYNLKEGYTTAALNFNREPRFYADLGFDGGLWYGQGHYDDKGSDLLFVSAKKGEPNAAINFSAYSTTGYWTKKLVNFKNIIGSGNSYTVQSYPWPVIRLAGLYLLYAEALNEASEPNDEVYKYINLVRARAGIPTVQKSWDQYSKTPDEYKTKNGLRNIIHRERLIELAFEGKRFWALRRWKQAATKLNQPITGWDLDQENAEAYYRERTIFNQTFYTRDYLWPLSEKTLLHNDKLVQNPGWGR